MAVDTKDRDTTKPVSQGEGAGGARPAAPTHLAGGKFPAGTTAEDRVCWVCGGPTTYRHCKIVCSVCGFTRDCSDP